MLQYPNQSYQNLTHKQAIELLYSKDEQMARSNEQIADMAEKIDRLTQIIRGLQRNAYGKSSEKLKTIIPTKAETVETIPFEMVGLEPDGQQEALCATVHKGKEKRKYSVPHPGRSAFAEHLERREVHIYPDGPAHSWGKELAPLVTERMVIDLAIHIEVTIRHKCVKDGIFKVAPFPVEDPFYKHKTNVDFVAFILMMRFAMHMPYYRCHGLLPEGSIGYNTVVEVAGKAFGLLEPLGPVLLEAVKANTTLLGIDEVPFDILDCPKNIQQFKALHNDCLPADIVAQKLSTQAKDELVLQQQGIKHKIIHKGRLWVVINPNEKLVYFDCTATREKRHAQRILEGYNNLIVSDAYGAYIAIAKDSTRGITLLLCWAHCRRKFVELVAGNKNPDPVAKQVIKRIGQLYVIEKSLKGKPPQQILEGRVESKRLLTSMKQYLEQKVDLYTPKDAMTQAIGYLLGHWDYFTEYTRHADGIMDNNFTERCARPITLNRKNALFFGSVKHSAGAALMFSLVENCKLHKVNVLDWLKDVLLRIATQPKDKLIELLPHNWKPAQRLPTG